MASTNADPMERILAIQETVPMIDGVLETLGSIADNLEFCLGDVINANAVMNMMEILTLVRMPLVREWKKEER